MTTMIQLNAKDSAFMHSSFLYDVDSDTSFLVFIRTPQFGF